MRVVSRLILIACTATLTGCTSWFGGSNWFSAKKTPTLGSASTASTAAAPDSTSTFGSLFAKKKPTPELYVATARLCESRGDFAGAATQYEKALKDSPDYVPALLSYAHLQDHQNKLAEATQLYQRAVKANPKEAAAFNDLGLCLARRGMATDALGALGKAVQLQPDKALYRNNLAVVLVDQHRPDDALVQLRAVDNEAVANYDLGVLLAQRQQDALAQTYFQHALELNSSFAEARLWNDHLANRAVAAAEPPRPQTVPPEPRIASAPTFMQKMGLSGAAKPATGAPQPNQYNVTPAPASAQPAANIPTSMQRPNPYGGFSQPTAVSNGANNPAVPPTPDNFGNQFSANGELRALPPVQ